MTRASDAGFTLIEMLVALAIFAVIGGTGLSVLDQVLRTQSRTEAQLLRLTAMQRSMQLVTSDFSQAIGGSVRGNGQDAELSRSADAGAVSIGYNLADTALIRRIDAPARNVIEQVVLTDLASAEWQFLSPDGAWLDRWPAGGGPVPTRQTRAPSR